MDAGIQASNSCVQAFENIKARKSRYSIMQITDASKGVEVLKEGELTATYDDFLSEFPDDHPRYGVFDYEGMSTDGRKMSKLIFFLWNPDDAPLKEKFMYTSTKETLRKGLNGVAKDIQAADKSDLSEDDIKKAFGMK